MTRRRLAACLVVDLAVWGVAVWLMTADRDAPLAPRFWRHVCRSCYFVAHQAGQLGVYAEARYYKEVQP